MTMTGVGSAFSQQSLSASSLPQKSAPPKFGMAATEFAFKAGADRAGEAVFPTAETLLGAYRAKYKNGWSAFWQSVKDGVSGRGTVRRTAEDTIEHRKSGAEFRVIPSDGWVGVPNDPIHSEDLAKARQAAVGRTARNDVMTQMGDSRQPVPVLLPETQIGTKIIRPTIVTGPMSDGVASARSLGLMDAQGHVRVLSQPLEDMGRVGIFHNGPEPRVVVAERSPFAASPAKRRS